MILESNPKKVPATLNSKPLPLLVPFSGRTKDSVEFALREINSRQDEEIVSLIHEIHRQDISGHGFRGYAILNNKNKNEKEKKHYQ